MKIIPLPYENRHNTNECLLHDGEKFLSLGEIPHAGGVQSRDG